MQRTTPADNVRGRFPFAMLAAMAVCALLAVTGTASGDEPQPKKFPGNEPRTLRPAEDGTLSLPARHCEVYGKTLQYMPEDDALGWWNSVDDRAVWKFAGVKPGTYEVWFEWSCADAAVGNAFVLAAGEKGEKQLQGKIPTTGSWQTHKKARFGQIEIPADAARIELRAAGPIKVALGDFREIRLVPVGESR